MLTARQRRMVVLPAPHGGLDRNDRYEIGIFYSFATFIRTVTLPLKTLFTSAQQLAIFISEEPVGSQITFVSAELVAPSRQLFDTVKQPTIFQSPYVNSIFVSPRKTNKNH